MSVNKAILIGRLGKDPEIRYMTNGEAVASFILATTETWKDKSGERQEKTEWHNISAFRRLAEIIGEYVHKGDLLYIEGKITTEKYTDKSGVEKYSTKIIANEMKMLGGKRDSEAQAPIERHPSAAPAKKQDTSGKVAAKSFDNFDDDIPF